MTRSFLVSLQGVSFANDTGESRQQCVRRLKPGMPLRLVAEPTNVHDRWAVRVHAPSGEQVGWLPSDARDADALLKGEPITASVHKLTGGTNWLARLFGKRTIGVLVLLVKGEPDWQRRERLTQLAEPFDAKVRLALDAARHGDREAALQSLTTVVDEIRDLTIRDPFVSAHRRLPAPVDQLSLLLERGRKHQEALAAIEAWHTTFDPVQPTKKVAEALNKRAQRMKAKIEKFPNSG